jgi:hypothetical protein
VKLLLQISISSDQNAGVDPLSLCLPLRRWQEGGRTLFLRSGLVVRVRFYLLWSIVEVVEGASERINLHQLYSHTGDNLLGSVSELMATCELGLLNVLRIRRDLFLGVSISFVVTRDECGDRSKVDLLERRCWSGDGGYVVLLRLH